MTLSIADDDDPDALKNSMPNNTLMMNVPSIGNKDEKKKKKKQRRFWIEMTQ